MEIIKHELFIQFVVGLAGAATMAVTDFRGWVRFIKHMVTGVLAAVFATPIFSPAIVKVLSTFMAPTQDERAAVYITGAFSIYVFELIRDFWAAKRKIADKITQQRENDNG